jgi:hypothetical protein
MTEVLALASHDDHEALFAVLATLLHDCQTLTRLLDQAAKNGNSYPMHLELGGLESRQVRQLGILINQAVKNTDHFSSTIEQVSVS